MCEPYHSIVQFEDDGASSGGIREGMVKKFGSFVKKIGSALHVSKMGGGHSLAIGQITGDGKRQFLLPDDTKYECDWATRTLKLDGWYRGGNDHQDAFNWAFEYANRVSIGDIRMLRRFLEISMSNTEEFNNYMEHARKLFNKRGLVILDKKLAVIPGWKKRGRWGHRYFQVDPTLQVPATRVVCGLTRNRNLLVTEWADCPEMWANNK